MRNQTKRVFTHKSKVFLTILCMLGLVFSWSCSCKNRVSDPTGGDNGDKGPDGETIIRTNGGAVSGTYTIAVASDGNSVKTAATVKFLNATGKLEAITDTDSTTLTLDDFAYTGTTLTLKDATETRAKITWDGVDTKKVKATFSLTPTATNVDLTTTTQEVEIEIGKFKTLSGTDMGNVIKKIDGNITTSSDKVRFSFKDATITDSSLEIKAIDHIGNPAPAKAIIEEFVEGIIEILGDNYFNSGLYSKVEVQEDVGSINPDSADTTKISFTLKPTIANSPFFEVANSFNNYKVTAIYKYKDRDNDVSGEWEHRAAAR